MNPERRFTGKVGPGLWIVGLGLGLLVLLWALGDGTKMLLRYERAAVFDGDWWRLVTGHLVHVDLRHTLLNVAGGIAMTALFFDTFSIKNWIVILVASLIACDVGFLLRDKDLIDYGYFARSAGCRNPRVVAHGNQSACDCDFRDHLRQVVLGTMARPGVFCWR
jgi:membrane associated rhomboid family serine protease